MGAAIEQGVAWQIKINRSGRRMSQKDLASMIGSKQSAISRMEDPSYGAHSLETLKQVAKAFDCALLVKFIPFSHLAWDADNLTEDGQYARSFTEEVGG